MSDLNAIPDGYHSVTPTLTVPNAAALIEFLKKAFDATLLGRHDTVEGSIMHAEVRIGDSVVMVSDPCGPMGPMPGSLYLYVADADATYQRALEAGATSVMEPADMFWGDRFACVQDPEGNVWSIAQRVEEVAAEEVDRRATEFARQMAAEQ